MRLYISLYIYIYIFKINKKMNVNPTMGIFYHQEIYEILSLEPSKFRTPSFSNNLFKRATKKSNPNWLY